MVSSFSLYIIRFEPKKPPCVQVNSSRYFELHFWEFFPSNFGAILTPQWAPKGSGGGIFHSPRPNQVWEGGHHPTRWHLAPGTCPNRPNLVPRQVQNWANLTNFMPFSVNSHPETGSKGEFCTTHGPIRCGQVATTQPGGTWHPGTCPNRSNLVPLQVQNWANLTYFMSILNLKRDLKMSGGESICNSRSNEVWAGGHHTSRWHLAPETCSNGSDLVPRLVQNWANLTYFTVEVSGQSSNQNSTSVEYWVAFVAWDWSPLVRDPIKILDLKLFENWIKQLMTNNGF